MLATDANPLTAAQPTPEPEPLRHGVRQSARTPPRSQPASPAQAARPAHTPPRGRRCRVQSKSPTRSAPSAHAVHPEVGHAVMRARTLPKGCRHVGAFAGFAHPTALPRLARCWEYWGSLRPGAYLGGTPLRGRFTYLYLISPSPCACESSTQSEHQRRIRAETPEFRPQNTDECGANSKPKARKKDRRTARPREGGPDTRRKAARSTPRESAGPKAPRRHGRQQLGPRTQGSSRVRRSASDDHTEGAEERSDESARRAQRAVGPMER